MYWRCSCGHKNPENARACGKCKSTESVKKTFHFRAILSASIVFFVVYVAGVFAGGTILIFSVEPTSDQILAQAKALGMKTEYKEEVKSIFDLKPKQKEEAQAKASENARASMSVVVRNILQWITPFLLFPIFGFIFGYSTTARTIIEVTLGSVVGQGVGFAFLKFGTGMSLSYLELGIGVAMAFVIVALGEYIGETFQEKKERAFLDETRDSLVGAPVLSMQQECRPSWPAAS
jgi:hypothetical protein